MPDRTTGWVQDPGRLENLIKVIDIFDYNTNTHKELIEKTIPKKILIEDGQKSILDELNSRKGYKNNPINNIRVVHLPGGNRPEIIAFSPIINPINGAIMDSKSYKNGFNIPNSERDKMIRYINEYNKKDYKLNNNKWWEKFLSGSYPKNLIRYSFISGNFTGQFLKQINYIYLQTGIKGSVITAERLIRIVENILDNHKPYDINEFFNDLECNGILQ